MTKYIIIAVVVMVGAAAASQLGTSTVVQNERVASSTVEVREVEIEVDVIEAAKAELDRINNELDLEERKLIDQQALLDAEYASKTKAVTARLDEIRETRMSF